METRGATMASTWSQRYGKRHHLTWIKSFPRGIARPKRVRIYSRRKHYVLQWWDPKARGNASCRVDGDLVAAITQARSIEERLEQRSSGGQGRRRLSHVELVEKFGADLELRADAGDIDVATGRRYRSALRHFLLFVTQPSVLRAYPHASNIDRQFMLEFSAFLHQAFISGNGHINTTKKPMRGQAFVEAMLRAMLHWATDPDRGNLLAESFRVPSPLNGARKRAQPIQTGEPDITLSMAIDFVKKCDLFQLQLFAPLLLCGLRASEPCFLFREDLANGWLQVRCRPELAYRTKGRRDKVFPLSASIQRLFGERETARHCGLLFTRRQLGGNLPLLNASCVEVRQEFENRCAQRSSNAAQRLAIRDEVFLEAGALKYDHIQAEFVRITKQLRWPLQATVKDFRHLFATSLENASMPEHYRQYFMGHAPARAPIAIYTHLNKIAEHYESALRTELQPIVDAIENRMATLGIEPP